MSTSRVSPRSTATFANGSDRDSDSGSSARRSPPESDAFVRGEVVAGRFRIRGLLGRGGGGQVFAAHDLLLDQEVALKIISSGAAERAGFDRLRAALLAARAVTHPNVCRIFDLFPHTVSDEDDGAPVEIAVMAMELLAGETLSQRLDDGPLPEEDARAVARQLAAGLAAAHAAGVLHLDFKSSNVLLVPNGDGCRAVIADFGLARVLHRGGGSGNGGGTPGYMAPEQVDEGPLSPATDVYSFGCVVHEMLTGSLPPASDARPVPEAWRPLLDRCRAPSPADRPADGAELLAALSPRSGEVARVRGWRLAAGILDLSCAAWFTSGPPSALWTPAIPLEEPALAPEAQETYTEGRRWLWLLEPERAVGVLERVSRQEPGHAGARLAWSEALEALGRLDEAQVQVERLGPWAKKSATVLTTSASRSTRRWPRPAVA